MRTFFSGTHAVVFGFVLMSASGCLPWTARKYSDFETLAEQKDPRGQVQSSIVRNHRYMTMGALISPEGCGTGTVYVHYTFFLKQASGEMKRLPFLEEDERHYYPWEFRPVDGSPSWLGTRVRRQSGHGHDVTTLLVFSDGQILHQRTFDILWSGRGGPIRSDDGNRMLIFQTEEGSRQYNVLEDKLQFAARKEGKPTAK